LKIFAEWKANSKDRARKRENNGNIREGRRKARGLILLYLYMLLSACGNAGDTVAEKRSEGTGDGAGVTTEITAGSAEAASEEEAKPLTLPEKAICLDERKKLYDISALLPEEEDPGALQDYLFEDAEHVLLLYLNKDSEGETDYTYTVKRLQLSDGSLSIAAENKKLKSTAAEEESAPSLSFCGTSPLLLLDSANRTFYPENKEAFMPREDVYPEQCFQAAGDPYYLDYRGGLYHIEEEQGAYRTEKLRDPDEAYGGYRVLRVERESVVLSAEPKWVNDEGRVCLRVSLKTGETEEIYTADDKTDTEFWKQGEGYRVNAWDTAESHRMLRLETEGMRRDLVFDGNDFISRCTENDTLELIVSGYAVSDGVLVFRAQHAKMGSEALEEHLLLWDFRSTDGKKVTEPKHTAVETMEISEEKNHALREELQKEFGIRLYIGDEIKTEYNEYTAEAEEAPLPTLNTLLYLQKAYRNYPKGFLEQLQGPEYPLRIYIVKRIMGDGPETVSMAGGLHYQDPGGPELVLASEDTSDMEAIIYHETTHAVYEKLLQDGFLDTRYDEWVALNPPGFEYGYTYEENLLPDEKWTSYETAEADYGNVYFIAPYNKTFQTEDIAELMARLMGGDEVPEYYGSEHLQAKCRLFFDIIREGFDTTGWPEKTYWEERLDTR